MIREREKDFPLAAHSLKERNLLFSQNGYLFYRGNVFARTVKQFCVITGQPRRQRVDDDGDLHPVGVRPGQVPLLPRGEHEAAGQRRGGPVEGPGPL